MSAANERRDLILEAIVTPDATPYGAAIRNKGRAALAELEAELVECKDWAAHLKEGRDLGERDRRAAVVRADNLEAELARVLDLNENLRKHADARMQDIARLSKRGQELEAELERLTVGRATLEDQTNRAELAEARVDALQTALREIAEDELNSSRIRAVARSVLVLSGGSE